jgi:hypothetical protein
MPPPGPNWPAHRAALLPFLFFAPKRGAVATQVIAGFILCWQWVSEVLASWLSCFQLEEKVLLEFSIAIESSEVTGYGARFIFWYWRYNGSAAQQ